MISKPDLTEYLDRIDKQLKQKITVVAVVGTAMTFHGLKESTKDVDCCVQTRGDWEAVKSAARRISSTFRLDLLQGGFIYTLQLPDDYAKKARPMKTKLRNLEVRLLSRIDIIITKTARLNERDIEDIRALVSKKRVDKKKLIERFSLVKDSFVASDRDFQARFEQVIKEFF